LAQNQIELPVTLSHTWKVEPKGVSLRLEKDTIYCDHVFISHPSPHYPPPMICHKCGKYKRNSITIGLPFSQNPNYLLYIDKVKQRTEIDVCSHDGARFYFESNGYNYLYCEKCNKAMEIDKFGNRFIDLPHNNSKVYLDLLGDILQFLREDLKKGRTAQSEYYFKLFDKIMKTHFPK
jgi:hypothetical protein